MSHTHLILAIEYMPQWHNEELHLMCALDSVQPILLLDRFVECLRDVNKLLQSREL